MRNPTRQEMLDMVSAHCRDIVVRIDSDRNYATSNMHQGEVDTGVTFIHDKVRLIEAWLNPLIEARNG